MLDEQTDIHVLILHSANSQDLVKHTLHSQFTGHSINNMDEALASVVPYERQIGNGDRPQRLRRRWRTANASGERTALTRCPSRGASRTWRNIWHRGSGGGTAGCYRWVFGAVSQGGGGGGGGRRICGCGGEKKCTIANRYVPSGVWFLRVIFGVTAFRLNPPESPFLSLPPPLQDQDNSLGIELPQPQ